MLADALGGKRVGLGVRGSQCAGLAVAGWKRVGGQVGLPVVKACYVLCTGVACGGGKEDARVMNVRGHACGADRVVRLGGRQMWANAATKVTGGFSVEWRGRPRFKNHVALFKQCAMEADRRFKFISKRVIPRR